MLTFALGNEIPPGVVRWHGRVRVERFLRSLYEDAKAASPESLFTYVNFPPTEFLDLSFFDICAFNVYLHREPELRAYLARLQHIAGQKPLLLAEAGADSIREGEAGQADDHGDAHPRGVRGRRVRRDRVRVDRRVVARRPSGRRLGVRPGRSRAPPEAGGARPSPRRSTTRRSRAERAAHVAARLGRRLRLQRRRHARGLPALARAAHLSGLRDHPRQRRLEGSHGRDRPQPSRASASSTSPNGGLSAARNVGLAEATGEIVAYTDADTRVDRDWLTFLVQPFLTSDVVGSGGPNVVPPDDPPMAQCIARAPGGPTHVLLDDRIAEHVPGCNMAFRRDALLAIGGFNPIYLRAGDDVDVCWRLQARGWKIGFASAALVWHHHRSSVKAYWRQQVGYGEGETWLMAHHPEKFLDGRMLWRGRIYSPLPFVRSLWGTRINAGVWGTAAFPSVYRTDVHPFAFLPHSIRWQVLSFVLTLAGVGVAATRPAPLGGVPAARQPASSASR